MLQMFLYCQTPLAKRKKKKGEQQYQEIACCSESSLLLFTEYIHYPLIVYDKQVYFDTAVTVSRILSFVYRNKFDFFSL